MPCISLVGRLRARIVGLVACRNLGGGCIRALANKLMPLRRRYDGL